ncbi:MAG TPA: sigma 54-interacting transcriptional regulator [Pyrinomonadaceae bacterium]|jgi:two-component system response regulator HydG
MNLQPSLLTQLNNPALTAEQRAQIRCQKAREMEEAGNYEAARKCLGELWQRIGERPQVSELERSTAAQVLLRAGALSGWIGSANQIEGAQEIAKDLITESIGIFETLQQTEKVAEAETDLAVCYWREGAYDEARATLHSALSRLSGLEGEVRAAALLQSAMVERSARRFNEALRIHTEAAPLFAASSSHAFQGKCHGELAIVLRNLSEAEKSESYLDRALVEYAAASYHFEQAGHARYCARVENNLGFLLLTIGRLNEAHEHLDHARHLFSNLKDRGSVAQVDETRARVFLAQGRAAEAERTARAAVSTLEQGDESSVLSEALTTHGTAQARLKNYSQARASLDRAIEAARTAGDLDSAGQAALTIIEELSEQLSLAELQAVYEQADELLASSQNSRTLARLRQAARRVLASARSQPAEDARPEPQATRFIYSSDCMAALLRDAHRIAPLTEAVLLSGETGTGKELLARLLHEWSGRRGPFVVLNCALLSELPFEFELFGHRGGNAVGQAEPDRGAVRQARGGTLFLDEITALGKSDQGKLLRLIEHGEVQTVGSSRPEYVDVRIIAATNCSLKAESARALLRDDLFYRLQTFHLEIPPLAERPEDISALAWHFIREALERHGERVKFMPEAVEAMRQLPLKGNARELRALIEQSILRASGEKVITREDVELLLLRQAEVLGLAEDWQGCSLDEEMRRYEAGLIKLALEVSKGSITQAARRLGISHQGLSYILQGRHKDLLAARTPAQPRRRSIFKSKAQS